MVKRSETSRYTAHMQPDFLILGCLLCIVLVLQILALLRRSDHTALDHVLREEHRVGRAELREQLETLERQQEVRLASFARSSPIWLLVLINVWIS